LQNVVLGNVFFMIFFIFFVAILPYKKI